MWRPRRRWLIGCFLAAACALHFSQDATQPDGPGPGDPAPTGAATSVVMSGP